MQQHVLEKDGWELESAVERNAAHPNKFTLSLHFSNQIEANCRQGSPLA
jgi:hypothetical protein